jgi:alpha-ketoglutarate-dependent taurine dioxygenase
MKGWSTERVGAGLRIHAAGRDLRDLPVDEVRALHRAHGFLHFTGFGATAEQFHALARRFMDRVRTTPEAERRQHPLHRGLQTVNSGMHALNFHADFGQLPDRPDVIALWCQAPALSGGETYVCDGVALWKALSEETRARFSSTRIRQVSLVDRRLWAQSAGGDDFDAVKRAMEAHEGVACTLLDGGAMSIEWRTWAAFRPRFSDDLAFCSNVFPFVYTGLVSLWDDGRPLEPGIHAELRTRAGEVAIGVAWQAGDFAIVDNTRWLHARAAQDAHRKVFTMLGYIDG